MTPMTSIDPKRLNALALRLATTDDIASVLSIRREILAFLTELLALLGRRPPQRVDSIVMPASEKPAQQPTSGGVVWRADAAASTHELANSAAARSFG